MTRRRRSGLLGAVGAAAVLVGLPLGGCATETTRAGIHVPPGAQARGVFSAQKIDLRNLGPGPAELTLRSASGRRSIRATLGPDGFVQTELPEGRCPVTIAAAGDRAANIEFTLIGAGGAGYELAIEPEQPPKTTPVEHDSGDDSGV